MSPAHTADAPIKKAYNLTGDAPLPLGCYSHAVQAGPFLYVCGLGARHPGTGKEVGVTWDAQGNVTGYDIAEQTRQVLENLKIVLAAAGCRLTDMVDVQVFLADMGDFMAFNQVYARYFDFPDPPARTTIEARPPGANFVEIKAIALVPASPETPANA